MKGWPSVCELIPYCEKILKLTAICKVCSNDASYSYRYVHTKSD